MKILVVDDEKMILNLTQRILERADFNVEAVESGEDAEEAFADKPDRFSLAIIDVSLPGISGPETALRLRKLRPNLPVIFSSGHVIHPDDLPDELQDDIRILQKPYRANELIDAVKARIQSRSSSS